MFTYTQSNIWLTLSLFLSPNNTSQAYTHICTPACTNPRTYIPLHTTHTPDFPDYSLTFWWVLLSKMSQLPPRLIRFEFTSWVANFERKNTRQNFWFGSVSLLISSCVLNFYCWHSHLGGKSLVWLFKNYQMFYRPSNGMFGVKLIIKDVQSFKLIFSVLQGKQLALFLSLI